MRHKLPWYWQVRGHRLGPIGESICSRKCRRMDRTEKGSPTGVEKDVSDAEGSERGAKIQGKRRQKRHAKWSCRD